MNIVINEINSENLKDINKCNGEFQIDSKLVLQLDNDEIQYSIITLPLTTKMYAIEQVDYSSYISNNDKSIFIAYIGSQPAGQLILRKNLEQVCVSRRYRGR